MKKYFITLITMISVVLSSQLCLANELKYEDALRGIQNDSLYVDGDTGAELSLLASACSNRGNHDVSRYVGKNDYFISIYPDYSMGQMYSLSYWYCKECHYAWDVNSDWFGDLLAIEDMTE